MYAWRRLPSWTDFVFLYILEQTSHSSDLVQRLLITVASICGMLPGTRRVSVTSKPLKKNLAKSRLTPPANGSGSHSHAMTCEFLAPSSQQSLII